MRSVSCATPPLRLQVGERLLEPMAVDSLDDLAVHLDQPPVRVVREARVAGRARKPFDRDVVQAEVEDRVHHPGHRDGRARAHRDEQRVRRVAETLADALLEPRDVLFDLVVEPVGDPAERHRGAAGLRRDREAGGDGDAELRHLREPDPFAAEELAAARNGLVERVHVARDGQGRPIFPQSGCTADRGGRRANPGDAGRRLRPRARPGAADLHGPDREHGA